MYTCRYSKAGSCNVLPWDGTSSQIIPLQSLSKERSKLQSLSFYTVHCSRPLPLFFTGFLWIKPTECSVLSPTQCLVVHCFNQQQLLETLDKQTFRFSLCLHYHSTGKETTWGELLLKTVINKVFCCISIFIQESKNCKACKDAKSAVLLTFFRL